MTEKKKTAPRGVGAVGDTVWMLERMLCSDFTNVKLPGLDYVNCPGSSAAEGNNRSVEHMQEHMLELGKCLDAALPIPAYDRTGILLRRELELCLERIKRGTAKRMAEFTGQNRR